MKNLKNGLFQDEYCGKLLDLFLKQLELINDHNQIFVRRPVLQNDTVMTIAEYTEISGNTPESKETNVIPMSLIQKRLYSSLLLNKQDPYNIVLAAKVKGIINLEKLEASIKSFILRHESLRTHFFEQDGELKQEILENVKFEILKFHYEGTENINALISSHIKKFQLSDVPLFDALYFESENHKDLLIFNFHHTISDGISVDLFWDEIRQIYDGNNLPMPPKQYRDYVKWENLYLNSSQFRNSEQYWMEKLAGVSSRVNLLSDFNHKKSRSREADSLTLTLNEEFLKKIKQASVNYSCSLFMMLLAAFQILLSKMTNESDIAMATTFANRSEKDFEKTIGMFANTGVLRNQVDDSMNISDFIDTVKSTCFEAYEHMNYPYNLLLNKLGIKGEDTFNVIFVYERANRTAYYFDGMELESYNYTPGVQEFEITLEVLESDTELQLNLRYQTSLFKQSTISVLLNRLKKVLEEFTQSADRTIGDITLVDESEKYKILNEFNNSVSIYPREKTIVELFEEQVKSYPYKTALVFDNESMTYEKLDYYANCIAKRLMDMGIRRNDYVALLGEKGVEIVVALLGILKAGGAYVPIDHKYPENRIQFMLQDCKPKAVLTYKIEINTDYPVVKLDDIRDWTGGENSPGLEADADDLAYIIYTSGTTGIPKGSMIVHRSVVRLVKDTNYIRLTPETVILQTGSISFDASTFEIWGALLNGGKVCLEETEKLLTPGILKKQILQENVNTLWLTSSLFNQMISEDNSMFDTLQYLLIGGEQLSKVHVEKMMRRGTNVKLINGYGPTENTTFTTTYKFPSNFMNILIGKPIANTTTYIMQGNQLCGIGMLGELCIGGDGLAKGYLNRPDLTAEKFIDNPFGEGKLYRSGDIVRWLPDGNIEYIGRNDEQIKIRGFRIELGEIETAIRSTGLVNDSVAVVKEDTNGGKVICAYFVSEGESDSKTIKEALRKILPSYMIPMYMMQIDRIPITRNGKLDKNALPAMEMEGTVKGYVPPRNEAEKNLVQAFEEILGIEGVGIKDNFFELGGDSIKAIRIISRMRGAGYELDMRDILQEPDLKAIAAKAVEGREGLRYEQGEVTGKIINTPIMKMFFAMKLEKKGHFNQAIMIKKESGFDEFVVRKVLESLAIHHDAIRAICRENALDILESKNSLLYDLKVIDFKEATNVEKLVEEVGTEIQRNMDLVHGPLLRAGLFRTSSGDHLMLCLHHLVVDGVSWRILLEDFKTVYNQVQAGMKCALPRKTASFIEWSEALEEYARTPELEKETIYWTEINETSKKYNIFCECNYEGRGLGTVSLKLDKEQTKQLMYEAGQAYTAQINDLLLSALGIAVKKWKNQNQVSVKLEGHGREAIHRKIAIDRTVGWFTCTYPVILKNASNISDSIINTKEMLRRVPNHGIGYGILCPDEEQIELCFNYLGDFDAESLEGDEITMSSYPIGKDVSDDMEPLNNISLDGYLSDDMLIFKIIYNRNKYNEESIQKFSEYFKESLQEVIAHCREKKDVVNTASDYGAYHLSDEQFRNIEKQVGKGNINYIRNLTPLQEGMLFHKIYHEESTEYVVQSVMQIKGKLDYDLVKISAGFLAWKYDVLRTAFLYKTLEKPKQVALNNREIEVNIIYKEEQEEKHKVLEMAKKSDIKRGFNLEQDSLLRITLVKLSDEETAMIWTIHHIIVDGWCISLLKRDFFVYYQMLASGVSEKEVAGLAEKERSHIMPYSKYLDWMEEKDKSEGLRYWDKLLEGYEELATIEPMGKSRQGYDLTSESELIELDPDCSAQIRKMASDHHVTVNTVAEAAWGVLLQNYCRKNDVVFGKVVSGRNVDISGIEQSVGLFINTVPIRVMCDAETKVSQLVAALQKQAVAGSDYDYSSLAEIQDNTELKGDLIKTLFVFENYYVDAGAKLGIDGMEISEDTFREETNYALTVIVYETDVINCSIMYNPNIYTASEIKWILKRFTLVMKEMSEKPYKNVSELAMIHEEERNIIFREFNKTSVDYPSDKTIVELFENQVKSVPQRTAAIFGAESVTYEELNHNANCIAKKLMSMGVRPNDYVALLVEKSVEVVAALLGILKAGGAYVPIDHKYPEDRIRFMLQDCNPRAVLTYKTEVKTEYPVLKLEELKDWDCGADNPEVAVAADDLAYVIYTSGTTGLPKGSMITHRNVVRLVKNTNYVELTSETVILQTGSISFDASTFEIWGALLNGGKVCLEETETLLTPGKLKERILQENVNTLWLTSSLFNQMISEDDSMFDSLQFLLIGGEQLSKSHVKKMKDRKSDVRLINGYGPTENTTFTTTYEIPCDFTNILIGKPIANTTCYIMRENKLCGIGMTGELCAAGAGVARGYLNQKELTREKFIENPFGEGKLYRTGDLVRWHQDGNIEYLGRMDDQVKIRGYRIELGEIEVAIKDIPHITETVVLVKENKEFGDKAIYAYFVADEDLDLADIKETLSKVLPNFMIPSYMMQIKNIPLNMNGKIDRKALPEIEVGQTSGYLEPQLPEAIALCNAFSEVLGVSQVGMNDNFFDIGGNSLKAVRVITKVREMGWMVSVQAIMQYQTVETIIRTMRLIDDNGHYIDKSEEGIVPLSPIQQMYVNSAVSNPDYFNVSMMFDSLNRIIINFLEKAVEEVVNYHEMLRVVLVEGNQRIEQFKRKRYLFGVCDFIEGPDDKKIEDLVNQKIQDIQTSLRLSDGPLLAVTLFRLPKADQIHIAGHQFIMDFVSLRIISEDIFMAYHLYEKEQVVRLPQKTASYKKWSTKLNELMHDERARSDEYWQSIAEEIKTDKMAVEKVSAGTLMVISKPIEIDNLYQTASDIYSTGEENLFIAAITKAVADHYEKDKIAVLLEENGRYEDLIPDVSVDRTVGWFTVMYPVILKTANNIEDILQTVIKKKEEIPYHGIGYLAYLNRDTDGFHYIPDIKINYVDCLDYDLAASDSIKMSDYKCSWDVDERNHFLSSLSINILKQFNKYYFSILFNDAMWDQDIIIKLMEEAALILNNLTHSKLKFREEDIESRYLMTDILVNVREKIAEYDKEITSSGKFEEYPLTGIQKISYNEGVRKSGMEIELIENIDTCKFSKVWNMMKKSHDVLRSSICLQDNGDNIRIYEPSINEIPFIDISNLDNWRKKDVVKEILLDLDCYNEEEYYTHNNLSYRVLLVKISDMVYRLLFTCSHMIFDGFSASVMKNKIKDMYDNQVNDLNEYQYSSYYRLLRNEFATAQEDVIMQMFDLDHMKKVYNDFYNANTNRNLETFFYRYENREKWEMLSEENKMYLSQKIFISAMRYIFKGVDIPLFAIHIVRKNDVIDLFKYIGEFLDVIPFIIPKEGEVDIHTIINERYEYLQKFNTYFSSLMISDGNIMYPHIKKMFEDVFNKMAHLVLVYNHLGILKDVDDIMISSGKHNLTYNTMSICITRGGIWMNIPIEASMFDALCNYLDGIMNDLLNKLI